MAVAIGVVEVFLLAVLALTLLAWARAAMAAAQADKDALADRL